VSARTSAIDVVETAYALDAKEERWLDRILGCALPELDRGLGMLAWRFQRLPDGRVEMASPVVTAGGASEEHAECAELSISAAPPDKLALTYGRLPFRTALTASESFRARGLSYEKDAPFMDPIRAIGIHDFLGIASVDPSGAGVLLGVLLGQPGRTSKALDRRWRRVMAHVLAAGRLRRESSKPEAVLEADGRVAHAEGPATDKTSRAALRNAARRIDRARGSLRRSDPEAALDLWHGLVSGRWSLIDHFDTDGRRYLVARENDPEVPDPRALDRRERQVLGYAVLGAPVKHIAYALGLDPSSVSRARRSAVKKLGQKTLADVLALMQAVKNG
jgi:DNA-binding CsgD family transcriptional regulator